MLSLLLLGLAGCGGPKRTGETIDIITDEGKKTVPQVKLVTDVYWDQTNLNSVLRTVPGNGREFHVSFEPLPRDEPERDNYLTRMRTEMMAGKGPDLFILDLEYGNNGISANGDFLEPVFPFPDKVMDNRVLLPLDEYMETALFTDFSKFTPELMEAGRNGEGQQIIPLTYSFDVGIFDAGEFDIPAESVSTREDMLNSDELALRYFASSARLPLDFFGTPYEGESLSFTEEELLAEAMLWREESEKFDAGEFKSVIDRDGLVCGELSGGVLGIGHLENSIIVPARNRDGGVTACVKIAAAVNRNSCYPEQAFSIIDKLSSESVMREQTLYGWSGSIVANPELGSPDKPMEWFAMTGETYKVYREALDKVTAYRFPTRLEQAVSELRISCVRGELADDGKLSAAVHKAYTTMQMMLAES